MKDKKYENFFVLYEIIEKQKIKNKPKNYYHF
ncbi:Uncharacterised protein (plasmid) [Mycoplasmopsis cynos]|uniref:Uncharacterized protein n=1 Tax=Mycoplasmopsis cynos TaxID=171284 RepID=A0A449AIA7_9BACT|nr:Uncharacterised protein [Mycoplasmopsis cynos]